ncbi:MAG TPA: alpha/beta hydrolase-fold protein [Pirellulales bacterium]|nr:alpha/beta hydrolase-fold protein [Pirellulales bacterium]
MNALLMSLLALELAAMPPDEVVAQFEDGVYTYTGGEYKDEAFHYRLLKPKTIEPGRKYPVVLFLHGAGERGADNRLQLLYLPEQMAKPENREKFPCFLIAPQCRPEKQWVNVPWGAEKSTLPERPSDQLLAAMGMLDDVLKKYPVDDKRVYLTGLSMGGYGCWDAAARWPERFAALAPICGGGDESTAAQFAKLPIWAIHGDADQAVPVARSRNMIEAVKKAGGAPIYVELKGVGHNSWTPGYSDPNGVLPWMFEQVREGGGADARPDK